VQEGGAGGAGSKNQQRTQPSDGHVKTRPRRKRR
jgi:hypothetical protein